MAVLSQSPRTQWADARRLLATGLGWVLFAAGWAAAKTLRGLATAAGAVLFAAGWTASAIVWPGLCWSGRAVRLGWESGRRPGVGQRGTA